ncbi:GNAT family N-acetyltransferase [soil metagenome]
MTISTWQANLTTHSGFQFNVRPASASDKAALTLFFTKVTPEDLRFRFLSGMRSVGQSQIAAMIDIDHDKTENFLAFVDDGAEIIATAMLACDDKLETGEVAIVIRPEYKARGVSWDLLHYVTRYAEAKGLKTIESIEQRGNHAAIDMEHQMGFTSTPYPDDSSLVLVQRKLGAVG